jgi:hypothetical protein
MVSRATEIVKKYNRRLARLNDRYGMALAPLKFTVGAPYKTRVTSTVTSDVSPARAALQAAMDAQYQVVVDLEISGDDCRVSGWQFAAVLTATEEGYLASSLRGSQLDLSAYVARGGDCDHCKANRRRTTTYVLRQGDDIKVVGSSCVADFTGSDTAAGAIAHADIMAGLEQELDNWEEEVKDRQTNGSNVSLVFDLSYYLSFVRASIRKDGWVPRSNERGWIPTADLAMNAMHAHRKYLFQLEHGASEEESAEGLAEHNIPTDSDRTDAERDIEFLTRHLEDLSSPDDYEGNLLLVLRQGFVFARNSGMASSICRTVDKLLGKSALDAKKADEKNEYFGTVGKRETFKLTLIYAAVIDGTYGESQLCIFADAEGRRAKWFNSSRKFLEKNRVYEMKGTVKGHEIYKERCVTQLTRCTVIAEEETTT